MELVLIRYKFCNSHIVSDINSDPIFNCFSLKADTKSSPRKWNVFLLLDYPGGTDQPIDEQGYELRVKLKGTLKKMGFMSSVQTEIDSNRY